MTKNQSPRLHMQQVKGHLCTKADSVTGNALMKPAMAVVMSKLEASAVIITAPGMPSCKNLHSNAGRAAVFNNVKLSGAACCKQAGQDHSAFLPQLLVGLC